MGFLGSALFSWAGGKRARTLATPAPPMPRPGVASARPAPLPGPSVPPEVRAMHETLARLAYRAGETLRKTALYFSAADLHALDTPRDTDALVAQADGDARRLLLRAEVRRGERYAGYAHELGGAVACAGRAASLLRLLLSDPETAAVAVVLRRVADAADRVMVRSARCLESEPAARYDWGGAVVAGLSEARTAACKARALLRKRPALLESVAEKQARAAVWAMEAAAEGCAQAALTACELMLPRASDYASGSARSITKS